ncbi:MAG: RelA/SpoT family protein [Bacteroidia bacterium]|nr:RelA/SpoT family protein [Bacteroidia bacterium]MDW8159577.1 RelA/SpoT family protein [Bacteroidia bacterium]
MSQASIPLQEQEKTKILKAYKKLISSCLPFTNEEERKLIREAFELSNKAHKGMRRKSGELYIFHPLAVAQIIIDEIGLYDYTSVICALIHDVVEDTDITLDEIQRKFGLTVRQIVDGLTKVSGVFDSTANKQAESLRKMLITMSYDIRVALIKIADRLHNMRTLDSMRQEQQLKISVETKALYAPLAHRLGLYPIKSELEDLALKYTEPQVYNEIARKLKETQADRDTYIQDFIKPIKQKMEEIGIDCKITGRVKSISSIYEKMLKQHVTFEEVYDIFAIRIVIDPKDKDERGVCWRAYAAITLTYTPHPNRLRDWISSPKANGYESLHTTVMGPGGKWVEVQIRTKRMDYIAERGLASHYMYKDKNSEAQKESLQEKWLNSIRDLLENKQINGQDFFSVVTSNLVAEQIYVFTPKGDLIELPVGATAIDFAYAIHTDIGNHAIGAKVNHKTVSLNYELSNGDHVEILTAKNQKPNIKWLEFAKTIKAKTKIKEATRIERQALIEKGKLLFQRKAKSLNVSDNHPIIKKLLEEFDLNNLDDFYFLLGSHRLSTQKLNDFINKNLKYLQSSTSKLEIGELPSPSPSELINPEDVDLDSMTIKDADLNATVKTGKCCNPIPGDDIIGISDPIEGIVIHRLHCLQVVKTINQDPDRVIKTKWSTGNLVEFLTSIRITGYDRMGMLNDIVRTISMVMRINIRSITIDVQDDMFEGVIKFYVRNIKELNQVITLLKNISGVLTVERT